MQKNIPGNSSIWQAKFAYNAYLVISVIIYWYNKIIY